MLAGIVAAAAGAGDAGMAAIMSTQAAAIQEQRRFSRQNEQEADRIGVELAARGGFDPKAAISLWEKMAKASGGGTPQWLSTHPSNATRIDDLKDYAERVRPLYGASKRN